MIRSILEDRSRRNFGILGKMRLDASKNFLTTNSWAIILILVFLINLLLVSPSLMPEFDYVNAHDEAKYVESGWRLLKGNIRDLAWGPLVAVVYAPVHLFVGKSPDWFMLELWVGRFILYTFLWWSTIYLSYKFFNEKSMPLIMAGVLFVVSPYLSVIKNQSDAVFVGFSMLGLAQLICYTRTREIKNIDLASLFVGLGVLARVETIVLVISLTILGVLIGRQSQSIMRIIIGAVLPTLIVVGLYLLCSLIIMGKVSLGVSGKSYDSFEWNQAILTGGDLNLAREQSRRLFGTEEENRGSIIRAILKNPSAYGLRILANAKTIPADYFTFFGKRLGAVLLVFAGWGSFVLIRRRTTFLLFIVLFWVLHVLISLGFLALHIVPQSSYLPFLLGAIGMESIFGKDLQKREKPIFLLLVLGLLIVSCLTSKPAFFNAFLMLAIVLCLHWLIHQGWSLDHRVSQVSLLLLFAAGLILREPFLFPNYSPLGKSLEERAVHYLEENFPSQSRILISSPLGAIAAKMLPVEYIAIPESIISIEELWHWLKEEDIQAVYLDQHRRGRNDIYDLFETGFELYFSRGFTAEDNMIRILSVK